MAKGALPNPAGAWRPALERRASSEKLELRAELEELCSHPAFEEIRLLMVDARDELLSGLTTGPTRDAADYARQLGTCHGLEALELLIGEIRSSAERAELKLREAAERGRRNHLEAVA